MITNENKQLIKFLFPTFDCLVFFKDQLFEELKEIIPENLCYSEENKKDKIRNLNNKICNDLIKEFFINNLIYKNEIESLYKKQIDEIFEDILACYIFLLKNGVNALEDKKSICYIEGISLLNII